MTIIVGKEYKSHLKHIIIIPHYRPSKYTYRCSLYEISNIEPYKVFLCELDYNLNGKCITPLPPELNGDRQLDIKHIQTVLPLPG